MLTAVISFRLNSHVLAQHLQAQGVEVDSRMLTPDYDFETFQGIYDRMHNPQPGGYTAPEAIAAYDRFFEKLTAEYKGEGATASQGTDEESVEETEETTLLSEFIAKVKEAGGMLAYVQLLNLEKIEKLVEEKKAELEAKYGVDSKPPKSPEELTKINAQIAEELEIYKKELLEKLDEKADKKLVSKESALAILLNS